MAHGRSKIFHVYFKGPSGSVLISFAPSGDWLPGQRKPSGGILGRFIEDNLGKRLKAFGIERVEGISLCQVEGRKPSSPQLTTEESENQF